MKTLWILNIEQAELKSSSFCTYSFSILLSFQYNVCSNMSIYFIHNFYRLKQLMIFTNTLNDPKHRQVQIIMLDTFVLSLFLFSYFKV